MQVPDAAGIRLSDHVQMHQVAVIGQEVVEFTHQRPTRIAQLEDQFVVRLDGRAHVERLVDIVGIIVSFGGPPPLAAPKDQDHNGRGDEHENPRAPLRAGIRRHAGLELPLACAGANDAHQTNGEHDHHDEQQRAERFLHSLGTERDGGYRHRETAWTLAALHLDAHLPRPGGHHPERAGEEIRILFGSLREIGW